MSFTSDNKLLIKLLVLVGPIATLSVSPWSNYDPINPIKIFFITTLAFAIFGLVISRVKLFLNKENAPLIYFSTFFVVAMLSTFIFSDAPKTQQIWGSFGRNTAFLTYFSLVIILTATSFLANEVIYARLISALIYTAIPFVFYCLVQIAKLDPIGWSEKYPFGTLGNINFSSAFLGFTGIISVGMLFARHISKFRKVGLLILAIAGLGIALSTGSIQGPMVFLSAMGLNGLYLIRKKQNLQKFTVPYLMILMSGIILTIIGLSNKGPLAKFLFSPSVVFRTDYWHAGWEMTLKHPLFGVGLDSYGDWYRQSRGSISTLRNNPERIANTAHNIFLDISSNGGVPLLIAFLLINLLALRSLIRVWRSHNKIDYIFISVASIWLGYMVLAAISINQVGVGIWGWIFTGALIGYERLEHETNNVEVIKGKKRVKNRQKSGSPSQVLYLFGFSLVGFVLSLVPLRADSNFRAALDSKDLLKVKAASESLGTASFHRELTLQFALQGGFAQESREVALKLIEVYPRDYMGWKALYSLSSSTPAEKREAIKMLKLLDPHNPNNTK